MLPTNKQTNQRCNVSINFTPKSPRNVVFFTPLLFQHCDKVKLNLLSLPHHLHTEVPITRGSGRRRSGAEKRISSFLTERRYLKNAILEENGEKEAFAPWIALFEAEERRRGGGGGGGGVSR